MKKILFSFIFALPGICGAAESDSFFKKAWESAVSYDNFHWFDNAMPATFFDYNKNEWMVGGLMAFWKCGPVSVDFGAAKPTEHASPGIPIGAVRLWLGELLGKLHPVKKASSVAGFDKGILNYITGGGWYARDFDGNFWRYGLFVGAELKF